MAKLSDKYIAGFLDADGYIGPRYDGIGRKPDPVNRKISLEIKASQLRTQDEVIHRIKDALGGAIYPHSDGRAVQWSLTGRAAYAILDRIRKHLIIKRRIAEVVLDRFGQTMAHDEAKAEFRRARREKSLPLPNFPPRKWLAGYFDGDGCINVRLPKGRSAAQVTLGIAASDYDSEGIEVICKSFGGAINHGGAGKEHLRKWTLTVPPSKAKQVLGYFSMHLINKKEQADFILKCAAMGHYRDGKRIKAAMKHLKAHPHRLSGSRVDIAPLVESVRDIENRRVIGQRLFNENNGCVGCGSEIHHCDGKCRRCYDKARNIA